ncbi:hypothetical protein J45TS6_32030 [Paenibacillus sp. J45TS6]|uniref:GNAT family N-acetyltransferase n=1 Tax=Paenibacillus sp. J45TS6 TaxID=2807196 RepID=UPI001B2730AB|nr:GNAT family N-acetyltransferase [Paenibacillus sp. J45TS6]GIP44744.1 hypothetical protein J45TS6_32030 [Paenibacillus sp. J45TS6]
MTEIREVLSYEEKVSIVEKLVTDLPDWFGKDTTITDVEQASGSFEKAPFFASYDGNEAVGFISLKLHTPNSAEIGMMGVLSSQHGKGIGKKLVLHCEDFCKENKIGFFIVKTIDESSDNESYKGTRGFYKALGFEPIEVFPNFWGEGYSCLYSIKCIK